MRNKSVLLITLAFISYGALGQQDTSAAKAPYFFSIHTGGLLAEWTQGSSFTTSFVHGIRLKKFAIGAGVGYDAFAEWRTLPVFARVNFDFASVQTHRFYLGIDAGYSKAWWPGQEASEFIIHEKGGIFYHPQVGYRLGAGDVRVYLSAGYKVQHIIYDQDPRWWIWGYPSTRQSVERTIGRLSVQIGVGLK
jgi:hypothetical protein